MSATVNGVNSNGLQITVHSSARRNFDVAADARHEISRQQRLGIIGENIHSGHTIESRLSIVKTYEWHG